MPIFLLILQIVSAIPTVVKAVEAIIEFIKNLRGEKKLAALREFGAILRKHHNCRTDAEKAACQADLEDFHTRLTGLTTQPAV